MRGNNRPIRWKLREILRHSPFSIVGLLLGSGCWLLDAALASFIFHQGAFIDQILHPTFSDLWMRVIILLLFTALGIVADIRFRGGSHSAAVDRDDNERLFEEALINSEARLKRYYEAGLVGMAVTSPDMKLLQINDKYCEITGYSREELLGKTFAEITHPDDVDIGMDLFQRAKAGEIDGFEFNKRYVRKDGRIIDVLISTKYVYAEDGSMAYSVGFVQDVTQQKQVERELRERESRLREAQPGERRPRGIR